MDFARFFNVVLQKNGTVEQVEPLAFLYTLNYLPVENLSSHMHASEHFDKTNKITNSNEKYGLSLQTAKQNYGAYIWGIFPESDQFFMRISRSAGCQRRLFRNSVRNPKAHWTLGATGWNKSHTLLQKDQPWWRWYFQNIRHMFVLDDQNNGFVEREKICQGLRTPILTVYCLQVEK